MVGPRQIVDPPTFTPLPYGLLTVAVPAPAGDPHWQNGVTWRSRCPDNMGSTTYDECIAVTGTAEVTGVGAPPPPPTKTGNITQTLRGATPFTAYAMFECSPVGLDDARRAAETALAQTESWQAERAFWTGQAAAQPVVFPHLAANAEVVDEQAITLQTAVVTGGGPYNVAYGLGVLEGLLADCYGGTGVIHVPQFALPMIAGHTTKDGARLRTKNGNDVAVGAGYPGTSPLGQARPANSTWLYATGPVFVYRSAVHVTSPDSSLDRSNNTIGMMAERTYVLGWDCCHVAVLVQFDAPIT